MDPLEQLTLTSHIVARATWAAFMRPLVVVTLVAFAVPALAAVAVVYFAHPLVSPFMMPLVSALGTAWAVHYPGSLVELSPILGHLGHATQWLLLPIALGWAGTLTAYARSGSSSLAALFTVLRRLPRLVLIGAPLVLLWSMAAAASTRALEDVRHAMVSATVHFLAAGALEVVVLTAGAGLLPLVVRGDLPFDAFPTALRRAWRWGSVALPGFAAAMVATAWAGRIASVKLTARLAVTHPDGLLVLALVAALVTALGLVVFAVASVFMAAALDEGWQ